MPKYLFALLLCWSGSAAPPAPLVKLLICFPNHAEPDSVKKMD
jgi:hypothetical protein